MNPYILLSYDNLVGSNTFEKAEVLRKAALKSGMGVTINSEVGIKRIAPLTKGVKTSILQAVSKKLYSLIDIDKMMDDNIPIWHIMELTGLDRDQIVWRVDKYRLSIGKPKRPNRNRGVSPSIRVTKLAPLVLTLIAQGNSDRAIRRKTGLHNNTIKRIREGKIKCVK